jgi:phage shock protein PspC (stress-responsive transcriptional regulator)
MFCSKCGKQLEPSSVFCPACGATVSASAPPPPGYPPNTGQLTRPRTNRMIAGVCAGFALHYGWDLNLTRVLTALMVVFTGVGAIVYLVAWVIIPEAPYALPAKGLEVCRAPEAPMFCSRCGKRLASPASLCSACGTAAPPADWQPQTSPPMLRPLTHRVFGGVCAAFAQRYGWKLGRVRLITVLLLLCSGIGPIAYLAAWTVIPSELYPSPRTST